MGKGKNTEEGGMKRESRRGRRGRGGFQNSVICLFNAVGRIPSRIIFKTLNLNFKGPK